LSSIIARVSSSGVTPEQGLVAADSQWSHPDPPAPLLITDPFSTRATLTPFLAAAMAAQQPAIPPPRTKTSAFISLDLPYRMGYGHLNPDVLEFCNLFSFYFPVPTFRGYPADHNKNQSRYSVGKKQPKINIK
jgi:hypothetical protein